MYKPGRPKSYDPFHKRGKCPPKKPGHYRIVNGLGNVMYIGESADIHRRMNEHKRAGKLKQGEAFIYKVADGRSTSKTRRKHERKKINKHKPHRNSSKGGEGRKSR